MSRIKLDDNYFETLLKMSGGNPGSLTALMELMSKNVEIDPQCLVGELGPVLFLDTLEIYGTDIYILFNDKCNRDVRRLILLLRACQLGNISQGRLRELAQDQNREFNLTDEEWAEQDAFVCEQLKDFKREEATQNG